MLSDGRSMFKNTIHVPVRGSGGFDEQKLKQVLGDSETLNEFKFYFLTLNTFSEITTPDYTIPENVVEYSQNIFVEVRR